MEQSKLTPEFVQKCVNTIRMLCVDSVQKANSGASGNADGHGQHRV